MNMLGCLLSILFIWLQYSFWFGKNGVCDLIHTYNTTKLYENINNVAHIKSRNNKLLNEIYDLIHGYDAVEERARYDLGMIKLDETFYKIELS